MHIHQSKYTFGDTVYLVTDLDQAKRMVTELRFSTGQIIYTIASSSYTSEHYEFELSEKPDESTKLGLG